MPLNVPIPGHLGAQLRRVIAVRESELLEVVLGVRDGRRHLLSRAARHRELEHDRVKITSV